MTGGLPERPLLPGFFRVIPMGDDAVQLRSAGRVIRLGAPGLGRLGPELLAAFDGRATVEELSGRFPLGAPVVEELVRRLHAGGVLSDGGDAGGAAADTVTAEFYEVVQGGRRAAEARAALDGARVLFAGLGPVARTAARCLAASHVGALVLADGGRVTAIDQAIVPGGPADGGRPRPRVVAEECLQAAEVATPGVFPPVVAMEGEAPIERILERSAPLALVVVEVDESGEQAEEANAACLAAGVPALFHAATTVEGVVGPAVAAGSPGCFACLVSRRTSHLRHYDEHLVYQAGLRTGEVAARQPALLGACATLAGGLVAAEALALLTGSPAVTRGGVLTADFRTLQVRRDALVAVPGCPACGRDLEVVAGS
ncbi:MAG TPA: TOMM precursor leader peptide-binding protein [Acidimicrobiales bacterium]|nr:TOMM precursor leader peptide-binding protein [Acidimicrobiales bacterium]